MSVLALILVCFYMAGVLLWYMYYAHRQEVLQDKYSWYRITPTEYHREARAAVAGARACWLWPIILPLALILKAHQKAGR